MYIVINSKGVHTSGDLFLMKVISFKLFSYQANSISELIKKYGVYANTSECIRIASLDYLNDLLPTEEDYEELNIKEFEIPEFFMRSTDQSKKAISCKFPKRILTVIDSIVSKSNTVFKSRTDFFRLAIERLISDDSSLFLQEILDNDQNELLDDKEEVSEERNSIDEVTPIVMKF